MTQSGTTVQLEPGVHSTDRVVGNRWWIYQKERFPLVAYGPLVAAFSFAAVG